MHSTKLSCTLTWTNFIFFFCVYNFYKYKYWWMIHVSDIGYLELQRCVFSPYLCQIAPVNMQSSQSAHKRIKTQCEQFGFKHFLNVHHHWRLDSINYIIINENKINKGLQYASISVPQQYFRDWLDQCWANCILFLILYRVCVNLLVSLSVSANDT